MKERGKEKGKGDSMMIPYERGSLLILKVHPTCYKCLQTTKLVTKTGTIFKTYKKASKSTPQCHE